MVAKDFTLQQTVLPLSPIWVECHERMARFFILMDHKMQAEGSVRGLNLLVWSFSRRVLIFFSVLRYRGLPVSGARAAERRVAQ
jgi:hypothetical protein